MNPPADMPIERHCDRCGTRIPDDVLSGHCPACLLNLTGVLQGDEPAPAVPWPLRRMGEYELLEEIARGGMGVVYRARQMSLNRVVALKMLLAGEFARPEFVRRFRREAESAGRLQHPNIVAIHEIGEHEGQAYFTMDYIQGPHLGQLVRDGPLPVHRAAAYLQKIAEAVHFAHEHGIVHRDLKPSNILIDLFDQPRITDFGLARPLQGDQDLTQTGQALGSPGYMSPEQVGDHHEGTGASSDIYSLGAVLYHLLTGRAPFQAETLAGVLLQVQQHEPVPPHRLNASVPVDLETICLKCLEKDPARRYGTAQEFAEELGRFLRNEPIKARPLTWSEQFERWCRRQPLVAGLTASVALLLILLALASTLAAWRIDRARRAEHAEREAALRANMELARANTRLGQSVTFLELQRAETFFRANDASMALAHLAAVLRRDPASRTAAERILAELLHRNWVLPDGAGLQHSNYVRDFAFSPDGELIVTGCADYMARIWEVRTRAQLGSPLPHSDQVRGVSFSPDGTRIATACADGPVRIWNWRTAEVVVGPMRHSKWVLSVAFNSTGDRIVTGSGDRTARVWSAKTGEPLFQLLGHTDEVAKAVFSPDNRRIATASYDGSVRLWDGLTGRLSALLQPGQDRVPGIAFSPDGGRLATASRDRMARIWDVETLKLVLPPLLHADGLNDIQFEASGHLIATAGFDNTVRLWDARSGELRSQPFRHREQVNCAAFHQNGRVLVTAADDWTAKFWDVRPGEALIEPIRHGDPTFGVNSMDLSPDGERVATGSDDHTARLWDASTRCPIAELPHRDKVRCVRFSPNGEFLLTACTDGSVWVWKARTGQLIQGFLGHADGLSSVAFRSDGQRFVTASADATARIWDVRFHHPTTPPLKHGQAVFSARFSPDGTRVLTASRDQTARVWDAETGAPITESLRHNDQVLDAQFSPDGLRLVTASMDNTARIWDSRSGAPVGAVLHHFRTVESIAFSPDGRRVVTGSLDHTARIWDAVTGEPLTPPLEHGEGILSVCFGPDGRRLATAAKDRTARIWDAETGLPLTDPLWHRGPVRRVLFSSDGERIATLALVPDGAVRIWHVPVAPLEVPVWLPEVAQAVAGFVVGQHGTTRLISEKEFEQIRQRVNALNDRNTYSRVVRWFFADRSTRTLSPFESETVPEYVKRRLSENTLSSLEEAVRLDPTNGIAYARLAKATLPAEPAKEPRAAAEAAHLARRALSLIPGLPEARKVLEGAGR